MPIDSAVAELLTAQLFVLVQEAPDPIYFYINSTGIAVRGGHTTRHASPCSLGPPAPHTQRCPPAPQKSTTKYGNEHEAIAVYNMMRAVSKFCPIYTLAVGNAFGEAALLLAAGSPVRPWRGGARAHGAARPRMPHAPGPRAGPWTQLDAAARRRCCCRRRASARRCAPPPSCSASRCSGCRACRPRTLTSTARSRATRRPPWCAPPHAALLRAAAQQPARAARPLAATQLPTHVLH